MSSWRLHMSDVENEKCERLAYTKVFKGKHTLRKTAWRLNMKLGRAATERCHSILPAELMLSQVGLNQSELVRSYFYSATTSQRYTVIAGTKLRISLT